MKEEEPVEIKKLVLRDDQSAIIGLPCKQCGSELDLICNPPNDTEDWDGHCTECATSYSTRTFRVSDHMMVFAVHFNDFCQEGDSDEYPLPSGDLLN